MATNSVIRESLALRRWSCHDGQVIPGEAFGVGIASAVCGRTDDVPASLKASDYAFTITVEKDGLLLAIDTYTAQHGPCYWPDSFDDEAWEAGILHLSGEVTRQDYCLLHRIARALLNGRSVTLADGTTIPAIQGGRA